MARARAERISVVNALGRASDASAIQQLVAQLPGERDLPVRHKLRVALTRQCRRQRDHGLVVSATHAAPDDETRHWLLEALTAAKSPAAFDLWVRFFVAHEKPTFRASAAEGLRRLADRRASPHLLALAQDRETAPRAAAVEALGALRGPEMLSVVVDALDDADGAVTNQARLALRKFGPPGCAALLERLRDRGATPSRCEALTWYLSVERSEEHLLEIMTDPVPEVRHAALVCLNAWGERFASDKLRDAIGDAAADPVPFVRQRAVIALRWFATTVRSHAALDLALEDGDPGVRAAAIDSGAFARTRA